MSFIEPFCTEWEAVTVNHLIELKRCLVEEWLNFQRAIIEDIRCGFSATYCVRSIYQTLKKFSRWFFSLKDTIGMALGHTAKIVVDSIHKEKFKQLPAKISLVTTEFTFDVFNK